MRQVQMGFLSVGGPAPVLSFKYPRHSDKLAEDVGRNVRTHITRDR
jgi:hypothetical protein